MMQKTEAVQAALRKWAREPFSWREDCMISVANYLLDVTGIDCATRFRGKYTTRNGCARISGFLRDPVKPFADCVAEIPLLETSAPERGDVGVVAYGDTVAGAICLGGKWAVRAENGVVLATPTKILKAWAV